MNFKELPDEITCAKCGCYVQLVGNCEPYDGMMDCHDDYIVITFDIECEEYLENSDEACGNVFEVTRYYRHESVDINDNAE